MRVLNKRFEQTKRLKDKDTMNTMDQSTHYQICLEGILDERWLRSFEGLEVTSSGDNQTIIRAEFDQSALHGLLTLIRDLGVILISVQRHQDRKESSV